MSKTCVACGQTKPLDHFYLDPRRKDQKMGRCKDCKAAQNDIWRKSDRGRRYLREWARAKYHANLEPSRERSRKNTPSRKPRVIDPFKDRARRILREAVRYHKITKPLACSECGWNGVLHGHHENYNEPLNVEWLCGICHGRRHRTIS